jgi:hypothetical protein
MAEDRLAHALKHCAELESLLPRGFVYVIQSGQFTKIGVAVDVRERMVSLQIGNPVELVLLKSIDTHEPFALERQIHAGIWKYHVRGEWFDLPKPVLDLLLKSFKT